MTSLCIIERKTDVSQRKFGERRLWPGVSGWGSKVGDRCGVWPVSAKAVTRN